MAKTKLTVATVVGTFTRTTARTYTHLVITTGNMAYAKRALGWKLAEVAKAGDQVDEWLKSTLAYNQEQVVKAEKNAAEGNYGVIGWCGSPILGQKAATKAQKDGYDNVKIIDVATGAIVR